MPNRKILMLRAPREPFFQEETLPDLEPNQVLIKSTLSTFKHGTEMASYHASSPFLNQKLDPEYRVFVDSGTTGSSHLYPCTLGNMTAGVVEAIGSDVTTFAVGDNVFGWLPVADWHISPADKLYPLEDGLEAEAALCIDPANFAIGGVMDGDIRYRDKVFVAGLGAIGLLAVQYCKLYGATVYASSSFPKRREIAAEYGADVVLNRKDYDDLGLEIKRLTGGGVDVALECSGNYAQLHQCVRATRQWGRVVCVGFYSGGATDLRLGEEFFHNRITMLASLPDSYWENPVRSDPPLFAEDLWKLIIHDFKTKRLKVGSLLGPTYPFSDAIEAVESISKRPQDVVKVAVKY